jgi:hypothetical protein
MIIAIPLIKENTPGNSRGEVSCQNNGCRLFLLLDFGEAFTAVYWTVFPRLERNLTGLTA